MKIGYIRVSTAEQNLQLQKDALEQAGCGKIFEDTASGAKDDRPGLAAATAFARAGDSIVVWKLDRLGRSLRHLIDTMQYFEKRGVGFQSLTESIDTTTPGGRLIFHIFGALAEFERGLIRERTIAGLKQARACGRRGGPKPKLDYSKLHQAKALLNNGSTVHEVCQTFKVCKTTLYKYLKSDQ